MELQEKGHGFRVYWEGLKSWEHFLRWFLKNFKGGDRTGWCKGFSEHRIVTSGLIIPCTSFFGRQP